MNAHEMQIPAAVADWMAPLLGITILLALGWAALAVLLRFKRRAYNLSPVDSTGGFPGHPATAYRHIARPGGVADP
jgi:hypothetical protein